MSRTGAEIRASEHQSKFIQDRITQVEKHFGEFCEHIAGFSRKLGKVRDKGDDVSRAIMNYGEHESHNHTTKCALTQFAENFSAVQDYREAEIRRLEDRVLGPLTQYGHSCKLAKERLKTAFAARKKEMIQQEKLEKMREKKPSDRHNISQAETDLQRAGVDAARSSKSLEEEMDSFERKKLEDIKKMLLDFVNIELMFHAKALEMYTGCYRNLSSMNEEEDLEEFRNSLRPTSTASRLEMQRAHSKTSLNSTMNGTAHSRGTTPAAGRKQPTETVANATGKSSLYSDDYGDDDDDDEEDDDDDDDEEDDDDDDDDDEYARRFQPQPHSQGQRPQPILRQHHPSPHHRHHHQPHTAATPPRTPNRRGPQPRK